MNIPTELNYKNVYLKPQQCVVNSRTECNTSVKFGYYTFNMPIYPSNMKSVVNEETCVFLARKNWFYTHHRFGIDNLKFIDFIHSQDLFASISIGIKEKDIQTIKDIKHANLQPEFITIDIANCWTARAEYLIKLIHDLLPNTFVIAGNIASKEACKDLEKWGANAIKCGIGNGISCTTRIKTGFTRPMITTILECSESTNVPIIADGGIQDHGDCAKALASGATLVMAGSLFAGYDQSAGDIIEIEGKQYKEYFGSASEFNKAERKNIEGKKILVPYKGSMEKLLQELKEDIQSSISYAGGKDLSALHRGLLLQIL